jgi:uncharacterized membrane protein (DUF485 family)
MPDLNDEAIEPEGGGELPSARNTRYGLLLFAVYLAFYGGFMGLSAFAPSLLEADFLAGLNLAVGYGLGLIVGALALALVYAWLCRSPVAARGGEGRR